MTDKLKATVEQRRSGARVIKLAGVLDEQNQLGELIEKVGAGIAVINLSGVERINSTGARDWVNWLASLEARGARPVLIACSPAVVAQLNRIKNFAGNGTVKSFQVPYHCSSCDLDKLLLVHVADLAEQSQQPPTCACDTCGATMTFVDESGTYFAFVTQLRAARPAGADESKPDLARGSNATVTAEHVKRISKPRLTSRDSQPSLSAFQVMQAKRQSEEDIVAPRPRAMPPANEHAYLVAIVALLLCAIGVLVYLLIM